MAVSDTLAEISGPATTTFSGTFAKIMSYAWVLFPIAIILFIAGGIWIWKTIKKKNSQWTHKLRVKRVGNDNRILPDEEIIRMRRFPLIKKAEVFELEKPLLGGYLLPELDQYSGLNEYAIIIDTNNRIYTNKGEFFIKDKSSINVSAKHSEIDISRATLKADFQNINKVSKRVEWATIAKYIALTVFIIFGFILALQGISKWGEAQESKAIEAQAQAQAMQSLSEAISTMEATVNTQKLEILPLLQELYGTKNIQEIINKPIIVNGTG